MALLAADSDVPCHYWAGHNPLGCALITPRGALNWQQLAQQVDNIAAQLNHQGVSRGSVLALVARHNSSEQLIIFLACQQLGAVCAFVPMLTLQGVMQKLDILYSADATRFICWLEDELPAPAAIADEQLQLDFLHSGEAISPGYSNDLPASIIFTSGSTGVPKAVLHTHAQHLASAQGLLSQFHFTAQDTWLLSLPLYHVSGLSIVYRWLWAGACLKVGTGKLASDIQAVTHASLVATQLKRLLDEQVPLRLSHVLLGGSDVPQAICLRAAAMGIETWLGYGMTEAASTVTAKRVDEVASAGRILPGRKIKLDNQRILIGGKTLASGYYYQGHLTPLPRLHGWYNSQDLGCWVGDEIQILGRQDNQFISGGENIHCEEIERALNRHPNISQAVVIPVHNAEFGARPVALVASGSELSDLALANWLAGQVEGFKIPDYFFRMPENITAGGIKFSRPMLKAWFSQHYSQFHPL